MQAGVSHAACRIDKGECRQVLSTFTPSHEDNGWQMDYKGYHGYTWLKRMIRLVRIRGTKMDYPVMKHLLNI